MKNTNIGRKRKKGEERKREVEDDSQLSIKLGGS